MLPYFILAGGTALLGYFLCEKHPSKRSNIIFLGLVSIALIIMSTIRSEQVGVDMLESYLPYFDSVVAGGKEFLFSEQDTFRNEFGYGALNYIISLFSTSHVALNFGIALLCVGLTSVFIYKYSSSVWVSMFIFISFGFFGYTLCTLRHQIAICIFMFALPHLQNKKFIPYLIIVLLSATFHKSMLVLIPIYFLAQLPLNAIFLSLYTAGALIFIIFSEPIMSFITQYVYTSYQVGSYYMNGRDFQTGFIPIVLFLVVLLFKTKLLKQNPKNLPLINLCFYTALLFLITYKHFVFQRFALILLPVAMLLLPEIMRYMAISEDERLELELARKAIKLGGGDKKRALQKHGEIKARLKDRMALYTATIGFILFGGFVYYLFLLTANRLWLVPYLTMWTTTTVLR